MSLPHPQTMVRAGAAFVIVGELVALATQFEPSPNSFVLFILAGGGLTVVGCLLALWGLLRPQPPAP